MTAADHLPGDPRRPPGLPVIGRRRLLAVAGATVLTVTSCRQERTPVPPRDPSPGAGRLTFRPGGEPAAPAPERRGLLRLGGRDRSGEALAWVPEGGDRARFRLVVVLHGAGGDPERALSLLRAEAEEHRLLLLAPKSAAATWDVIAGGYGPDVRRIDRLLASLTAAYPVGGLSIAGFSDGASYALSLALGNGDVFDSCAAFSPGFAAPPAPVGRPRFFVSHGTGDRVLPIDRCSRRIVPRLEEAGYAVEYREFEGGHEVPAPVRSRAAAWLTT